MIHPLPEIPRKVLGKGVLCHLGSAHPSGPHVTPVVFALHGSSLWVTTSRNSVKARTWRMVGMDMVSSPYDLMVRKRSQVCRAVR